jgi:hypothetical protein
MSWPSWTKFDFPSHDKWVSYLEDWGKEYGFRAFSVSDSKKNNDQRTSNLFKYTVANLSCRLCRGDEKKSCMFRIRYKFDGVKINVRMFTLSHSIMLFESVHASLIHFNNAPYQNLSMYTDMVDRSPIFSCH